MASTSKIKTPQANISGYKKTNKPLEKAHPLHVWLHMSCIFESCQQALFAFIINQYQCNTIHITPDPFLLNLHHIHIHHPSFDPAIFKPTCLLVYNLVEINANAHL